MNIEEQVVWAPDKDKGFVLAKIVDIGKEKLTLETLGDGIPNEGNKMIIEENFRNVFPADTEDLKDVDDNCCLMYLNPGTVLNNIRTRYFKDKLYTYVSNILISLNPYFDVPGLYSEEMLKSYIGKSLGKEAPHTFAIAEKAYRDMNTFQKNQVIIISGESGAGKTECTKHVIKYLTHAYGDMAGRLEQKIMDSNPILEAFGNAKTIRNNNSSRFGKFVEIYFDEKNLVSGGLVSHYLLEKSRICSHDKDDRNFHIFYQLCIGADREMREKLKIKNVSEFKILSHNRTHYFLSPDSKKHMATNSPNILQQLEMYGINGYSNGDVLVDDYNDFTKTNKCLEEIGLLKDQRMEIFAILASILHLGNINFQTNSDDPKGGCHISPDCEKQLTWASEMLKLDSQDLRRGLTYRMITSKASKGTVIQIPLKVIESSNLRDSLLKAIYSKLFDNIIQCVNDSMPIASSKRYVGILDIAGFEFFVHNGFEQFCINYCNEKIQHYFNYVVLQQEQEIYKQEGLSVKRVNFYDDQEVINLLEAKSKGILDLLDEENKLTLPDPVHFTMMVHDTHSSNTRLDVPRKSYLKVHKTMLNQEGFIIKHYAGAVCYDTKQFIEKNNDALHFSLNILLQESKNALMQKLFSQDTIPEAINASPKSRSRVHFTNGRHDSNSCTPNKGKLVFPSVSGKFKEQLNTLIQKFSECNASFIKCIKPNSCMKKHFFEGRSTLNQLESCGTIEVLKLMEYGYPSRISINDLYARYKSLLPETLAQLDIRIFCQCLFKSVGLRNADFMFGCSKVFFRSGKFADFDELVKSDPGNLNNLILNLKVWILRAKWKKVQWCVLAVIKLKNKIKLRKDTLIVIQKNVRMHLSKVKHQPRYRGMLELKRMEDLASKIPLMIEKLQMGRETSMATLLGIRDDINTLKNHIKVNQTLDGKFIKERCENLAGALSSHIDHIKKLLIDQCRQIEAQRLKDIQLVIEREKRVQESKEKAIEEGKSKKESDQQFVKKPHLYAFNNKEGTTIKNRQDDFRFEDDYNTQKECKIEHQEKRDLDLALRLSEPLESSVYNSPLDEKKISEATEKYNLSSWKYIELRDTINTSCDLELLEACREEFHRRLKVYHEWKTKNKKSKIQESSMKPDLTTRIPSQLVMPLNSNNKNGEIPNKSAIIPPNTQNRYFRVPFWQNSSLGIYCNKGWWYAHFQGNWVVRQMELYEGKEPLLLSAGKDDMQMCELSLEETGLRNKLGAEIIPQEFDMLWAKLGGLTNNV